jgi:Rps23 Pro-64 3,4-dihydroxylase Tpa1-like proline 4-hydroxylase
MQIIDNFLPEEIRQVLLSEMDGLNFPWFYRNHSTSHKDDKVSQFIHIFNIDGNINSSLHYVVVPMIEEFKKKTNVNIKAIHRIKANLMLNAPVNEADIKTSMHIDTIREGSISFLYYVDDSDGDTILYKDDKETELKRIQPKANRAVIFNSNIWHNATPPKKYSTRRVINFIFDTK